MQSAYPTGIRGPEVSWLRIVFWTVAFQFAWNWRKLAPLFGEGALPDTDDYVRLQQVRDWLGGQGWFDLVQHRMDPPLGADIHWSRLIDLPIAALIRFFDLFLETALAERLAALVWPTLLLVATVLVIVRICRALADDFNPLLAVLFTVMCLTALTEFIPGRIDHHSVQILLFCLVLLGLVHPQTRWGHLLTGAAMAASLSVGLDSVLLVALILAWLGVEWAAGRDRNGSGLMATAAGIALAAPLLFIANIPPSAWLTVKCDANSAAYFTALMGVAGGFALLAGMSRWLPAGIDPRASIARLGAGMAVGGMLVAALYVLFPECAAGPYGAIDPILKARWLVNVNEAMGLGERLGKFPELWFSGVAYSILLLGIGAVVVWKHGRQRPGLVALYAALALSIAAALIQYRALRIGIFSSIPLCVIFAGIAAAWIDRQLNVRPLMRLAANAGVVALLLSPVWWVAGTAVFPSAKPGGAATLAIANDGQPDEIPEWKKQDFGPLCNEQRQYEALAALPRGLVMSDINSGPVVLAMTGHSVVGGPYHRNARAIIDMLDFFGTNMDEPARIARQRAIDYVWYCDTGEITKADMAGRDALAVHILQGTEPQWLERLTPRSGRFHLFRVRKD